MVAAFCSAFAFLASRQIAGTSATFDETSHLPSGYSYLLWNDYRMNPEHPPLVKEFAALPLLWSGAWPRRDDLAPQPDPTSQARLQLNRAWAQALVDPNIAQWNFGHQMLYGIRDETAARYGWADGAMAPASQRLERGDFVNDTDALLARGRLMILALGVALALLVYFWTRELFGIAGGVLALALYAFDPNFLAHSALVTTDVGVALFMFGAVYFLWRACRRLDAWSGILTALFFALAFVTKFSAVLLVPIFAFIGLGRIFSRDEWPCRRLPLATKARKALAFAALLGLCGAMTFVTIWAIYGFRYSAMAEPRQASEAARRYLPAEVYNSSDPGSLPIEAIVRRTAARRSLLAQHPGKTPDELSMQAAISTAAPGLLGNAVLFAQRHRLLPEAWLYGLAYARFTSLQRSSFLMGEYSDRGFRSYFLWAFLFKTPLPALLAIAAAIAVVLCRRMPWASQLAFFAAPVGIYMLVSLNTGLNIGHRHLLPIYPFLFVLCGALAVEWSKWKPALRAGTAAAALAAIAISSSVVFAPPWRPAVVFPHYLGYFNELAGGPRNGHRILVDSNIDWGQDLPGLRQWMDAHMPPGEPINLCYFGMADPRYHGIPHINMPGSYVFEKSEDYLRAPDGTIGVTHAVSPGYLAISATHLPGVYFSDEARGWWRNILSHATLVDTVGYSILIYKIDGIPTK